MKSPGKRSGFRFTDIAREDPRVVRRILTHLGLAGDEGLPADLADP